MKIRLIAFASASALVAELGGEFELAEGATVGDLTGALARLSPPLAAELPRFAIAVDGEISAAGRPLSEGAEVALLPPVSGG